MAKFITVPKTGDGREVLINIENITHVRTSEAGTSIFVTAPNHQGQSHIITSDDYETVKNKILYVTK